MLRKCLIFAAAAVVAGLALAACGSGPGDPNPPDMPMQVTAADSLSR